MTDPQPTSGDNQPRRQWNATEAALVQGVRDAEALAAVTQERDALRAENRTLRLTISSLRSIVVDIGQRAEAVRDLIDMPSDDELDAARAALEDTP